MNFKLDNTLNNRVFLTNFSELEERLDPLFYVAVKKIREDIVAKANYKCEALIKSCSIKRGRFGHRPRNDPRFYDGKYPFIQTGDIVKAAENNTSIEYTQTLNELGLGTSRLFHPPQLLFTIAANIGDTAILDYPSCFPDSIVALTPNNDEVSLEYLNVYLKLIKPYVVDLAPYAAQKNLNNQQLAQVPLIIPPKEIQKNIVDKMEQAYNSKQQKEQQAQDLLNSIDTYLLKELGITIPEKDNSLKSRMFTIGYNELTGSRFDPGLYDNHTKALKIAITSTHFKCVPLKTLIVNSSAGDWGIEPIENNENYKKCLVIRATEFDNEFNLKLDNSRIKYRSISTSKLEKINISEQDLLIEKSGGSPDQPVGRIAIIRKNILDQHTICYSNFIHKIALNKSLVNPEYAFAFLKTMHNIKITESMQSQTNGIRNLIMSNYFNQSFVLPTKADGTNDMEKQNKIANHISGIRAQAKHLQQEAQQKLDKAQQQIENIILGS